MGIVIPFSGPSEQLIIGFFGSLFLLSLILSYKNVRQKNTAASRMDDTRVGARFKYCNHAAYFRTCSHPKLAQQARDRNMVNTLLHDRLCTSLRVC